LAKGKTLSSATVWVVPVLLAILIFAMAARTPLDSDMWWHLRAGEVTWTSRQPLMTDIFSSIQTGSQWINHSWLSQVGMYLLFRCGGYLALGAAVALLATLSMMSVYLQMSGSPLLRAFLLVLGAAVCAPVWTPRPQLVSLVLFAGLAYLLYLYKWRQRNLLWLSVPLFILWSNLHGGYVLGLLLMGSILVGELLNHGLRFYQGNMLSWRSCGKLALWLGLAGLVVVINPNGEAMWTIPFKTIGVNAVQQSIDEWGSPNFHILIQQPMIWLLLATLGAIGLSSRRLDGSDLVSLGLFTYLALLARRNFGPFAVIALPILSRHLVSFLEEWRITNTDRLEKWRMWIWFQHISRPPKEKTRLQLGINILICTVLLVIALGKLALVSQPAFVQQNLQSMFPDRAAAWVEFQQPKGKMFNDYNWGGFLIWRLPEYPVFIDGRTDLYTDQQLADYVSTINGKPGWEQILTDNQISLVVIPPESGLAGQLDQKPDWWRGYGDETAVVYLRQDESP
jgi:hypothetical protein